MAVPCCLHEINSPKFVAPFRWAAPQQTYKWTIWLLSQHTVNRIVLNARILRAHVPLAIHAAQQYRWLVRSLFSYGMTMLSFRPAPSAARTSILHFLWPTKWDRQCSWDLDSSQHPYCDWNKRSTHWTAVCVYFRRIYSPEMYVANRFEWHRLHENREETFRFDYVSFVRFWFWFFDG